ncbi:MAG: hypothetical protein MUF34_03950 [Polyangiaceae bacterium]|nr:hypothetical protein [Polyangiaceae bacterium]
MPARPIDFRYVGLSAGPSERAAWLRRAGTSAGALGLLLASAGLEHGALATVAAAGGVVGLVASCLGGLQAGALARGGVSTSMAIVPWGVLVRPDDDDERVLHWPGVRGVSVRLVYAREPAGMSMTPWSVVTVTTARERLVGRASGSVGLERLMAHLEAYTDESSRPLALDLFGDDPPAQASSEPSAAILAARARELVASARGAEALRLRAPGYRTLSSRRATEGTAAVLREALRAQTSARGADLRALAAFVAAEARTPGLLPELSRLVTASHPLVAAAAKVAALRLGGEPTRFGSLSEVAPFLLHDDLLALEGWLAAGA